MATLFPVMVNVGISLVQRQLSAPPAPLFLSYLWRRRTGGESREMSLIDFAFKTTLPISIVAISDRAFLLARYLDKKSTSDTK